MEQEKITLQAHLDATAVRKVKGTPPPPPGQEGAEEISGSEEEDEDDEREVPEGRPSDDDRSPRAAKQRKSGPNKIGTAEGAALQRMENEQKGSASTRF